MRKSLFFTMLSASLLSVSTLQAQLSTNPDKFLGNITTRGGVDAGGGVPAYYKLWNQITCENESKWASVEGTRNSYNWSGADRAFNYAKQHNFTYKFHALVWGAQYPGWLDNLVAKDRFTAMTKWFNAVKSKYNTLPMIDVVNEAVGLHQASNPMMKETLGGGGKTGYDWLIKAFEMAYERWPNAILIYNDYNTFQWDTDNFIDLVRTLRDAGAPIDAYGCQSHDLTDCSLAKFKESETKIQTALKMPMYSTEYDIGTSDDNLQLQRYKEQIPYMWEKPYCAGITLWGYIYGATWTTDGNSGIYKGSTERPAMTWLKEYMASDAAKKAVGPFPGMKKEASVYIRPAALKVAKGDSLPIRVRAAMATKTIEKVDLYVGSELIATMTKAPYRTVYAVPKTAVAGWKTLKAVVTTTDGATYERLSRFNVLSSSVKREPYNVTPQTLPGTISIVEYDKGASGVSYYNASRGVVTTKNDQWMDYTVEVADSGLYSFDAEIASAAGGGMFHLAEYGEENLDFLTDYIVVPSTGSASNYKLMHGQMKLPLKAGRHVLSLMISKGGFTIKSIKFNRIEEDNTMTCGVAQFKPAATVNAGDSVTITVNAISKTSTISRVEVYANNLLIKSMTEAPYTFQYVPEEKGTYAITAIAIDAEGKQKTSALRNLKVNGRRVPYKAVTLPGVVQAENFDKGGEGLTFHDSDSNNQGDSNYRSDGEGVDMVKAGSRTVIGYTVAGEWLEYSVNVTQAGEYKCVATVSSGITGSGFTVGLVKNGSVKTLCKIDVPQTGSNNWDTYSTVTVEKLNMPLETGEHILRVTINGANCNIDKLEFICIEPSAISTVVRDASRGQAHNLYGVPVASGYRGIVIKNGKKYIQK